MNAAEKARLAKEKEEQEKKKRKEEQAQAMRQKLEDVSGWTLFVVTILCGLGTLIIAYFAFIGGLDEGMKVLAWSLLGVDAVVIGLDALHAKWSGNMLMIDEGVALYAIFIGFVFLSFIVILMKSLF